MRYTNQSGPATMQHQLDAERHLFRSDGQNGLGLGQSKEQEVDTLDLA